MALVIKKRVSLDYLGDDFKDAELVFQSIPARDIPEITKKSEAAQDKPDLLIPFFIEILEKYFLEGSNKDEKYVKEDLATLDADSVVRCFQEITGQNIDPKDEGPLTSTSSTEAQ